MGLVGRMVGWSGMLACVLCAHVRSVVLKYSGKNECHRSRVFCSHPASRHAAPSWIVSAICLTSGPEWGKCHHKSENFSRPSGAVDVKKKGSTCTERASKATRARRSLQVGRSGRRARAGCRASRPRAWHDRGEQRDTLEGPRAPAQARRAEGRHARVSRLPATQETSPRGVVSY